MGITRPYLREVIRLKRIAIYYEGGWLGAGGGKVSGGRGWRAVVLRHAP